MSRIKKIFLIIIFAVLIPANIYAANYSVKYGKEINGKFNNTYPKWNKTAASGQIITTPKLSDRPDGTRCYWIIDNKKGAANEVESGSKFKITRSVNMYAVWKNPKASYKSGEFCIRYGKNVKGIFNNTYARWNRNANLNQTIKLPSMTDRSDGTRCCWLVNNKAGTEIVGGEVYTVKGDVDFYAVWKKKCVIKFFKSDKKTELPDLRTTICSGTCFILPVLKDTSTRRFVGWQQTGYSSIYKGGTKIKVPGNCSFNAVYADQYKKAILKYQDGSTYKEILIKGKEQFPSVSFTGTKVLQGWSPYPGKTHSPEYIEEDLIPNVDATYYMVVYDSSSEKVINTIRESSRYKMVYFIGDSRIARINNDFGKNMKTAYFIGKEGQGYKWLTEQGGAYDQLINQLKKSTVRRNAVVFALGINDLKNINNYVSFYKTKASELKKYGCELYVMSINPFCREQRNYYVRNVGYNTSQKDLKVFNNTLKVELKDLYSYINTNSYLRIFGWGSSDLFGKSDGLHYSKTTNIRIINKVMELIG